MKIGKISAKIHEIGKIKAIFGLGMTPIYGLKNGQIKSLHIHGHLAEISHRRRLDRGRLTNKDTAILGATITAQGGYKSSGVFMATWGRLLTGGGWTEVG